MNKSTIAPEFQQLAELVGDFIEYWGFKKIHGKIWVHLYLSEIPLDAAQIMKRLKISKTLVSISLKDLLDYNVILESGLSHNATRTYEANPNLSKVITHILRSREKHMLAKIQASFQQLKKIPKEEQINMRIPTQRMKDLDQFIKNGEKGLEAIIALI